MMALMLFALWMLASLALLGVWVFRRSPPIIDDRSAPPASAVES